MSEFKPNKKWAKTILPAVKKVIETYKTFKDDDFHEKCPLCISSRGYIYKIKKLTKAYIEDDIETCHVCPWIVLDKYPSCITDKNNVLNYHYKDIAVKDRFKRLNRWKRKLEKIINA